jgi:hypothetical protein
MERQRKFLLWAYVTCAFLGGALARSAHAGGPSFALTLVAPGSVEGPAGGSVQINATGKLTSAGIGTPDGAQAWSISIGVEGWTPVAATTAGTAGACDTAGGLRDCTGVDSGFEKTEITTGAGNEGVVSEVILSFNQLRTLPPSGTVDIIRLTLQGTVPQPVNEACQPSICRVAYVDGRRGSGDPIDNVVSYRNASFLPTKGEARTSVCPVIPHETNLIVEVVDGSGGAKEGNLAPWTIDVDSPAAAATTVNLNIVLDAKIEPCFSTPATCTGENFVMVVDPETGERVFGCSDMMDNDGDGKTDADDESCIQVQGFSFSAATGDCFNINQATTRGTIADLDTRPPGIRDPEGSFEKTEVVNPANNGGQQGAVCAVVFSFTKPIGLAPVSRNTVAKLRGSLNTSGVTGPGVCTDPCLIQILDPSADGLAGSGEPVKTAITVSGETKNPGICNASVRVCGRMILPTARFIRCDPNDDGQNNIADSVWIVNELFRMGLTTGCQDAGDCNDDGMYDLTDAIFGIDYQFRGGMRPFPPYPNCGIDPTTTDMLPECMPPQACP